MIYDAVVIGGGPGGYVAAIRIAQLGGKVAVVEKDNLGGTCLNRGCIPTKALITAADKLGSIINAEEFGIEVATPTINFAKTQARKEEVVNRLVNGIHMLFKKNKVDLVKGVAKVNDRNSVEVNSAGQVMELKANNIIIATGSRPALIKSLGYNGQTVLTSEEALLLPEVPESLLIIGAGVIGCEFAHIFSTLGSKITMVDVALNVLPMLDRDITKRLQMSFKKKNIMLKTNVRIKEIVESGQGIAATLETGEVIAAEKALISIGRYLNTENLGLEDIKIARGEKGEILVNDKMETNIRGIYAIGDVVNKYQLAHVASAQGLVAAENIMGQAVRMNYDAVPSCVFTNPQLASVGITEQEAKNRDIPIVIGKFNFMANGKALSMGESEGIVKVIAHKDSDVVLGVHIIGPHASDLISEATVAVHKKITAKELATIIHAHPTLAETIMEAAENVHGLSIHG